MILVLHPKCTMKNRYMYNIFLKQIHFLMASTILFNYKYILYRSKSNTVSHTEMSRSNPTSRNSSPVSIQTIIEEHVTNDKEPFSESLKNDLNTNKSNTDTPTTINSLTSSIDESDSVNQRLPVSTQSSTAVTVELQGIDSVPTYIMIGKDGQLTTSTTSTVSDINTPKTCSAGIDSHPDVIEPVNQPTESNVDISSLISTSNLTAMLGDPPRQSQVAKLTHSETNSKLSTTHTTSCTAINLSPAIVVPLVNYPSPVMSPCIMTLAAVSPSSLGFSPSILTSPLTVSLSPSSISNNSPITTPRVLNTPKSALEIMASYAPFIYSPPKDGGMSPSEYSRLNQQSQERTPTKKSTLTPRFRPVVPSPFTTSPAKTVSPFLEKSPRRQQLVKKAQTICPKGFVVKSYISPVKKAASNIMQRVLKRGVQKILPKPVTSEFGFRNYQKIYDEKEVDSHDDDLQDTASEYDTMESEYLSDEGIELNQSEKSKEKSSKLAGTKRELRRRFSELRKSAESDDTQSETDDFYDSQVDDDDGDDEGDQTGPENDVIG